MEATVAVVASRSPERPSAPGHYFDSTPATPSRPHVVALDLPGVHLELATDTGVFSADRVDTGTKALLLDGPPVGLGSTLLDLGCGYGAIACTLAVRAGAGATVWAVDVNERALVLCRANAEAAGVGERVRVTHPDAVPGDIRFDGIWSNPPIRIGKPALRRLLSGALGRLADEGKAYLVVAKHLGADSLTAWLESEGWPTSRLGSRLGYRLLEVRRP